MSSVEIVSENGQTFYLIPLSMKIDYQTVYLDITEIIINAKKADVDDGYSDNENGPNYGFEVMEAMQYVDYVNKHAVPHTLNKFSTSKYKFTVTPDI